MIEPGRIVILNGAPRAGKSSLAAAIQAAWPEPWLNLGVDAQMAILPTALRPGIGLRPGGERPDLEPFVQALYAALYDSLAAHSRQGLNLVADVGHHDGYSRPLGILPDCARRLADLPVWFVGVRCPIETILARRAAGHPGRGYVAATADNPVPEPVRRWQEAVHAHGLYDLDVDTSRLSPEQAAAAVRVRLEAGPGTAFPELAKR